MTSHTETCKKLFSISLLLSFALYLAACGIEESADSTLSTPSALTATAGSSQVALSWSAVSGASSYTLFWKTSSGVSSSDTSIASISTNSYTHTSLSNGTTYYYKVAAVNSSGTGTLTSEVNATPTADSGGSSSSTLSAPANLSATATTGTAVLDWDAVSGAASYTLFWGTSSGITSSSSSITSISTDNYTHTSLSNGSTYYYKVAAVDAASTGSLSSEVSVSPVLSVPANLSVTAGNTQNSLDWDNVSGAASYTLYWGTSSGITSSSSAITSITNDNYTHTSLSNDTTYYYKVAAVDAASTGSLSSEVSATPTNPLLGGAIQGTALSLSTEVTTLAGGTSGYTDATGTSAKFDTPAGITTDGTNLYVTENGNHTIRKIVISTGVVTTLAGTAGTSGSNDATGTSATFRQPKAITTDGTNLYVADTGNNKIRKIVISSGVVTTLAGTGSSGTTDNTTGTNAQFNYPIGITTDGTNLYVADRDNRAIRKIVISSGFVSTLAGTMGIIGSTDATGTSAKFYNPQDVTTDGTNIYVADGKNTIRKVVISSGVVTTLAGTYNSSGTTDATGADARFKSLYGITTDGINLYVTSSSNKIRKIVISTGVVTTVAGSGTAGSSDATGTSAQFYTPYKITTDGTNLYVAEYSNNTVRKIQ
ncbi:MAG: fibronectin type III domain-containing protein [SAR324 cluster bacterium]|nr:fibronectin type III domain-containing protein [SAR324 cluster bacterium]